MCSGYSWLSSPSTCLLIISILDFFQKSSFVIFVSLDFQIFQVPLSPPQLFLGLEKACCIPGLHCCWNPPPHPTLPPFPSVSPASPAPTEERKLVPSNWYKTTFCFYATHAKRRGKRKGERTPQMLKKGKKRNPLLWSSKILSMASPHFLLGSHRPGPNSSAWWLQLFESEE